MADILLLSEALRAEGADEASAVVRSFCEPLPLPDEVDEFGAYFDRFADAKVILPRGATMAPQILPEPARRSAPLDERMGAHFVAVEADWPDAARIDRHVRHHAHEPSSEEAFSRFPTWMWRNVEVRDFVEWLRRTMNTCLPRPEPSSVASTSTVWEVQSPPFSPISIGLTLRKPKRRANDTDASPHGRTIPLATRAALHLNESPCEEGVLAELRTLLDRRLAYVRRDGKSFFDAAQNARVVRSAEHYYRLMYRSAKEIRSICATGTCSTPSCGCSPRGAAMRKPSFGRIIHMSAMPRRLPWVGKASSTSANPAARPSVIQQCWSALAPIAGRSLPRAIGMAHGSEENHSRTSGQL